MIRYHGQHWVQCIQGMTYTKNINETMHYTDFSSTSLCLKVSPNRLFFNSCFNLTTTKILSSTLSPIYEKNSPMTTTENCGRIRYFCCKIHGMGRWVVKLMILKFTSIMNLYTEVHIIKINKNISFTPNGFLMGTALLKYCRHRQVILNIIYGRYNYFYTP